MMKGGNQENIDFFSHSMSNKRLLSDIVSRIFYKLVVILHYIKNGLVKGICA